tara:strand:+ start:114 stop:314 length:201 start_codon:yes stop_codon:yes gene_type:complete
MITVNRRQLKNFKRMIESDNLLLQSKFQKDLGNLGMAKILLERSKKLSRICKEESLIFDAQNILKK